ncbi:MAG TPA: SDR family oxidoreductase [Myxococcota bacterium]|jgi:nucleoside-diphosphate-sugar epimerase
MHRCLIAGCGYVGAALGSLLSSQGHTVYGLRRHALRLPAGVEPFEADLGVPASLARLPGALDFVFYLASPGGAEDALYRGAYVDGLRNLQEALARQGQRPRRVLFASSTAVYGQHDSEWVDENSPAEPVDFRGQRLLEAEQLLASGPSPGVAVRFGGIYGPRRSGLVAQVRAGRAVVRPGPPHYTNRIHRDDCAGVLRHLMQLEALEAVYLGVDCEPADEAAVLRWLAGALGAAEPRLGAEGERHGRERRASKRCRNDRLLASGYRFLHPTFREGYRAILAEQV